MSCAPAEWQRLLQRALAGHDWAAQGDAQVRIALAGGALTLHWAPGPARQIALLRLGLVHAAQGQLERAQALLLRLQSLRSELAAELDRAIPRP